LRPGISVEAGALNTEARGRVLQIN
jgi:hypothetical protein